MKKKVLVCVSIVNDPSEEFIKDIRSLKDCDGYNVVIHIYDYRLLKGEKLQFDFAKVKEVPFEKRPDVHTEIAASLFSTGSTAFIFLPQNVRLDENFINICGLDKLSDENVGSVYTDFRVTVNDTTASFFHKSMPIVSNLLPIITMSRDVFLKNIDSGRDAIAAAINTSLSRHIPKKTFTLNING